MRGKGYIPVYLLLSLMIIASVVFAESTPMEGEIKNLNLNITNNNGVDYIPLRQLARELDWGLSYIHESKTVVIHNGRDSFRLSISNGDINGYKLNHPPIIIKGRTFLNVKTTRVVLKKMSEDLKGMAVSLTTDRNVYRQGDEIVARVKVINLSEEIIKLRYRSGQLYDLYLVKGGQEVWRWSEGKYFTMALIQRELKPGEGLEYEIKVPVTEDLETGYYSLKGILATESPVELPEVRLQIKG